VYLSYISPTLSTKPSQLVKNLTSEIVAPLIGFIKKKFTQSKGKLKVKEKILSKNEEASFKIVWK